jgi:chemotaxis protein methyltransferase CheR
MTAGATLSPRWQRLRLRVSQALGLDFPREAHLRRLVRKAAAELGVDDEEAAADRLVAAPLTPDVVQVLARHLTVGETYFFRDLAALDALEREILPALLRQRHSTSRRLRVWCAACCTGEEPYSIAILLHRLLPDLAGWDVAILGTDINASAIAKAEAGRYGDWSFRNVPLPLRARYFRTDAEGRHCIVPEIRRLVKFQVANLVGEMATGPAGMDLVLCRNVLMYFDAGRIAQVVRHLASCVVPGGHLVVGPGETPSVAAADLEAVHYPGAVLFRKLAAPVVAACAVPAPAEHPALQEPVAPGTAAAVQPRPIAAIARDDSATPARRARELADEGRLDEALACCDRWLAIDKLDAAGHYTRAMILLELGRPGESRTALQRALYAQADFVMAHVALGHLARGAGDARGAQRHFATAGRLLRACDPAAPVPEGDGFTAAQMLQTVHMLAGARAAA